MTDVDAGGDDAGVGEDEGASVDGCGFASAVDADELNAAEVAHEEEAHESADVVALPSQAEGR